MMRKLGVGLLVLFLCARGYAGDPRAEAKAHFERGSVLYDLQRYEEAAAEYEAAYEAKPDPALLFNVGQAYRFAKKPDRAIAAYNSYLRRLPQAKNRAEIELRIEEMKALEAQQRREAEEAAAAKAKAETPPPAPVVVKQEAPPPPRPATVPSSVHTLKWAGLGLGLGGVAIGLIGAGVYGAGAAAFGRINEPTPGRPFDPADERAMNVLRPTGVALLFVGVAATVTGFTLFGINYKKERSIRRGSQAVLPGWSEGMEVSQ